MKDLQARSKSSALTTIMITVHECSRQKAESEKREEQTLFYLSQRASIWIEKIIFTSDDLLSESLCLLSEGVEPDLDDLEDVFFNQSPGYMRIQDMVERPTLEHANILAAVALSFIHFMSPSDLINDLDPLKARDSYLIMERPDHSGHMKESNQTAFQWLGSDDAAFKLVRDSALATNRSPLIPIQEERKAQIKQAATPNLWDQILVRLSDEQISCDTLSYQESRNYLLSAQTALDLIATNNSGRKKVSKQTPPRQNSDSEKSRFDQSKKDKDLAAKKKAEKEASETKKSGGKPSGSADKKPDSKNPSSQTDPAKPEGMTDIEWNKRKGRSRMDCSSFKDGHCSKGSDCQYRHANEPTSASKMVAVLDKNPAPFEPPAPKESDLPTKEPNPDPDDDDFDDSEGFAVVRPRRSISWDTKKGPGSKDALVIFKEGMKISNSFEPTPAVAEILRSGSASALAFATPLADLTPDSKNSEQDFRLRMKNKFEPDPEVSNLIRFGAEVLPCGSARSAKGVPASTWQQQRRTEDLSGNPQVFLPQDMSTLMLLDVGPESEAALLDDDLESEDSVDLSSQEDEDVENILALKAKANGHQLLTNFFSRVDRPIPAHRTPPSFH
jgi:hypothetical protein